MASGLSLDQVEKGMVQARIRLRQFRAPFVGPHRVLRQEGIGFGQHALYFLGLRASGTNARAHHVFGRQGFAGRGFIQRQL